MARVLVYFNALKRGKRPSFEQRLSDRHRYLVHYPTVLRANAYTTRRTMGSVELMQRLATCFILYWKSFFHDVLLVDVQTTAFLTGFLFLFRKKPKIAVYHFNILHRRTGLWLVLGRLFFRRIDLFIVRNRHDVRIASELYRISPERFVFYPYVRRMPTSGEPSRKYLSDDNPFIISFGNHARDYDTFFRAVENSPYKAIVVTREWAIRDLLAPRNVSVFHNIPSDELDRLVSKCRFSVFTFTGQEPSCGHICVVTSLMLGKPVIASNWMSMDDYVREGENGLLCKLHDPDDLRKKIEELWQNEELYTRLSIGARRWATKYTDPESLARWMDKTIEQLVPTK